MTFGGVRADVVGVVVQAELVGQRVLVGRHLRAELGQSAVSVALGDVAEQLVVAAVLLHQKEHVLDRRGITDRVGTATGAFALTLGLR